jgi:tetratricopeptide (TPR) repeat protein
VLLDRKRVKFWQKWVFGVMALLMALWLVSIPLSSWMGCGGSSDGSADTLDDRIAALERQISASPAAVELKLELAETLRRRANQQVEGSEGRTADLQASAAAYEAYVKKLARTEGTKAEVKEAERLQIGALEDLIKVHLALGDYEQVTSVYGKLTELRPQRAEYFYDMGRVAINAGDTNTALLAFTRYLELAPDSDEADQVEQWIADNAPGGTAE